MAKHPPGCLLVQSGQGCGEESNTRNGCAAALGQGDGAARSFQRARKEGDLPKSADPARSLVISWRSRTVCFMQASAGATTKDLREVAKMAILAWPAAEKKARAPKSTYARASAS